MKEPRPTEIRLPMFSELTVRHLATALILASVIVVLGTTLYPFDFTFDEFQKRLQPFLHPRLGGLRSMEDDIVTNVILFLPIGCSFAILATRANIRPELAFLIVTLGGALLSLSVELLQLFLPFRFSSFIDVASNAVGASGGFVLYKLFARTLYHPLTSAIERANRGHTTGWLAAIYGLYLACVLWVSAPLQYSSLITDLDMAYPLVVGNEPGGNRPWSGSIHDLIITKHGLSAQGTEEYLSGKKLNRNDSVWVLAHYVLGGDGPYSDLTKNHPPLEWKGSDTIKSGQPITSHHWLQTSQAASSLSSWIMMTTRFSICLTASAGADFRPEWFARIVAVLSDPYHQNFSLVQIDDNLGVRFRSMTTGVNGTNPQFIVPDVFTDTLRHRIVVTLNNTHLHIYVDSVQRHYELDLGPGFALLNRFFPSRGRLNLATRMKDFHNYLFAAFVFIPLGYVLGAMVRHMRRGFFLRLATAVAGIAAAPLLMEWKLQQLTGRGLSINNLWIGCALILATLILTVCWPRKIQTSVEEPT